MAWQAQRQYLRVRAEFPAVRLKLKHLAVLTTFATHKAPQRASLPDSLSVKFALRSGAKGSSLGADSDAYAASASKGAPKVLSREARAKALSSANRLCGDEKNETSSCVSLPKLADAKSTPHRVMSKKMVSKLPEHINARSTRVSALSRLSSARFDLREFLASKRKSELLQTSLSCCQQVVCKLGWSTQSIAG